MNDVRNEELVRLSFRRELTPEEESHLESYFAANPEARAQWQEDRALGRALQSLADVPVSSNFTAGVLQAVDLEEAREQRGRESKARWRILLPRFGWPAAAALLILLFAHNRNTVKQERVVKVLAEASRVSSELKIVPEPDVVLQDFEVINQLVRTSASSDDELLMALQ
ncbi:MAG TPA: hypothetical protein VNT99_06365 [Methylomirabilota bacterium]|nr:hypothetical protein [Methylomirabilota bacterium]